MTKNDVDFDTWFEELAMHVLDVTGVDFVDRESVKQDYEVGRELFDVVNMITQRIRLNWYAEQT